MLQKILICKSLSIFNVGINGSGEISYFKTTDHVVRQSELVIERQILSLSYIQEPLFKLSALLIIGIHLL